MLILLYLATFDRYKGICTLCRNDSWQCAHSMWSRVYRTLCCPPVCLSQNRPTAAKWTSQRTTSIDWPRVGSGACRISPPRFLAECCKRQLNQCSFVLLYFRLFTFSDLYWVCLSVFSCTVLFVSISQVIGCEDSLRNDLYCVEWGVKLCSNQPTIDGLLHGAQQRGEQMRAVPHCQHT